MSPIEHVSDVSVCREAECNRQYLWAGPSVSNAYLEMKQYSTIKNSDFYSVNASSLHVKHAYRPMMVRTDISNFATFR